MYLKSLLMLLGITIISNASQLSVSIPKAVNTNHKLIKDLYIKNEALNLKIMELEEKINSLTNSKISNKRSNTILESEYFVAYETLNVRNSPDIKNSKIVDVLTFGDKVICESVKNFQNWCKNKNKRYVYKKGLVPINNKLLLTTKSTNLHTIKSFSKTESYIEKGSVLSSKGKLNDQWYVLQNNLLINSNDVIKAKEDYSE